MMFNSTQAILNTQNVKAMYRKTAQKGEASLGNNFTGLQTYFRIVFKNGLATNRTKSALAKHYGSAAVADEFSFRVCKILMDYEYSVLRNKLNRAASNSDMRLFEKQMAIFGLEPENLRCTNLISELRNLVSYSTIDF